jgi:VCBS repeat-containing protein
VKHYPFIRISKVGIILLLAALLISPLENATAMPIDGQLAAGITISPTVGLITTESGGTASFTVVLNTRPTATVIFNLSSSDLSEGTISTTSLTFRTNNWFIERTITVTGVDDQIFDRDIPYLIVTEPASSSDPIYNGMDAADVSITNRDNETGSIIINPTSNLITTEAGATATFSIVLSNQPIANVAIGLSSSDSTEASISPTQVIFSPSNWSTAQTATITGIDDQLDDGDQPFKIITSNAISTDLAYNNVAVPDVTGVNMNNDFRPNSVNDAYQTNANPNRPMIISAPGILGNDTDKNNDLLNAIQKSNPQKGTLVLNADGSFVYTPSQDYTQVETDSFTYVANDGTLDSNLTTVEVTIDPIIPSINWISPVPNGEIYEALDQLVRLETEVTENYSIDQVTFYRWDAMMNAYVDIGVVKTSPYLWDLDIQTLNLKWNQIFARVSDGAGNISPRQFIWIYRDLPNRIFLPTINR